MVKYFYKGRTILVAILLACAAPLVIQHLRTGATTSSPDTRQSVPVTTLVKEIEGYKEWTKVNPVPQLMPERVAIACAIWLGKDGVIIDGPDNPHRGKYFTVYVNDTGRTAMLKQRNPEFAEGSIIVKEKLPSKDNQKPELLTVMIKQKQGFNPASGDWEYMVLNGEGTKMEGRGKLENCQSCHVSQKLKDYVFRTYLPADVEGKLKYRPK